MEERCWGRIKRDHVLFVKILDLSANFALSEITILTSVRSLSFFKTMRY